MPDIAELGKRVRAKYPGAYDNFSDADLGLRVQKKYPGSYDAFTAPATVDTPAGGSPSAPPAEPIRGMEQLGGVAPGVPSPVLPAGLPAAFTGPLIDPKNPSAGRLPTADEAQAHGVDYGKRYVDTVRANAVRQVGSPSILTDEPAAPAPRGLINSRLSRPASEVLPAETGDDIGSVPVLGGIVKGIPLVGSTLASAKVDGLHEVADSGPGQAYKEFSDIVYGGLNIKPKKGQSDFEGAVNGFLHLATSLSTPETVATMFAGAGLTKMLPELANLPQFAEALKNSPTLAKGFDMAARGAVPGAFALEGGKGVVEGAKETYSQLQQGNREGAVQAGAQTVGSAFLAAFAGKHALELAKDVGSNYPISETPSAKETATAAETGGLPGFIKPDVAKAAVAKSETLKASGQNLAAAQWDKIASNGPVELGGDRRLEFVTVKGKARPGKSPAPDNPNYPQVVDTKTGKVIVGGEGTQAWLDQQGYKTVRKDASTVISFTGDAPDLKTTNRVGKARQTGKAAAADDSLFASEPTPVTENTPAGEGSSAPAAATAPRAGNALEEAQYKKAVDHVREAGKASTSQLQRQFKMGYGRATAAIDRMESEGIVGPADGSKPRAVLATPAAATEDTSAGEGPSAPPAATAAPPASAGAAEAVELSAKGGAATSPPAVETPSEAATAPVSEAKGEEGAKPAKTTPAEAEPAAAAEAEPTPVAEAKLPPVAGLTVKEGKFISVKAAIDGDTITVTTNNRKTDSEDPEVFGGKPKFTTTLKLSDWAALDKHPNPNYPRAQLVRKLLKIDEHDPDGSARAERVADAHVRAIESAIKIREESKKFNWKPSAEKGGRVKGATLAAQPKTLDDLKVNPDGPTFGESKVKKPVTPQIPNEPGTKYVLPSFVTQPHSRAAQMEKFQREHEAVLTAKGLNPKTGEPVAKPAESPSNAGMRETLGKLSKADQIAANDKRIKELEAQAAAPAEAEKPDDEDEPPPLGKPLDFKAGHHIEWDDPYHKGEAAHGKITSKVGNMYQVELPDRGGTTLVPATEADAWKVRKHVDASADEGMVARIKKAIDSNEDIRLSLEKIATKHYGGGRASGAFEKQKLYEMQETAMNQSLAENGPRLLGADFNTAVGEIRDKMGRLATQTVRSDEKVRKQQFSTPPQIAYLADRLLGASKSDTVLEPSAGTGGLVALLRDTVKGVHVNEIDPERSKLAESVGFKGATAHDGEIIHAMLDPKIKPTRIVMNPPFSSSALKNDGKATVKGKSKFGYNHVESAMQRLQPGGRAVIILGGGMDKNPDQGASLTAPASTKFWQRMAGHYTLRANVRIAGKEYAKYGTTFGTRIVVIDKTGATPGANWLEQLRTIERSDYATVEDAWKAVSAIAEAPATATGRDGAVPADGKPSGEQERGTGVDGDPGSVQPGASRGTRSGGSDHAKSGARPAGRSTGSESPAIHPGVDAQRDSGDKPAEPESAKRAETPAAPSSPSSAKRPDDLKIELAAKPKPSSEDDAGAFATYHSRVKGNEHSGDIVESKSMATVALPPFTYRPSLPADVDISAIQMESVILAGQQNDRLNPDGSRAAVLIGDGTGVGKGRTIAAVLLDNWNKGRRRMLWVSKSWPLEKAAKEDLESVGATELAKGLKPLNKLHKSGKPIEHEGVIFTTYDLLRSQDKQGNTVQAMVDQWLKGSDEADTAYIAWDESHTMKNTIASGRMAPSQIGTKTLAMRQGMPKARQLFLSATAATDVINFGYLERLGLWGPQTPFPLGFTQFVSEIGEGGVAAMELIARELKATGKYIARTLSYRGVRYDTAPHELNDDQKKLYRDAAQAWRDVTVEVEKAVQTVNGGRQARAAFMNTFWGGHQRFFNLLITALKTPTALEVADKALAEGKAVLITLVNTNEAAQSRQEAKQKNRADDEADEDDSQDDLDFGPKDILIDLVKQHYPTQQWVDDIDDNGKAFKRPLYRLEGGKEIPVSNPQAEAQRDVLVKHLEETLRIPENPLDILINHFGRANVAEMTGRSKYYDAGTGEFVKRGGTLPRKEVNLGEMRAFQNDDKRVAVVSGAAGTGISLHAALNAKNQRERVHITLQPGWSADKAMQMLGRSHRTNQKQAPHYVTIASDLSGEKRFTATIAKRMATMGALTRGSTDASGAEGMDKADYFGDQGVQAVTTFGNHLLADRDIPGVSMSGRRILEEMGMLKKNDKTGETSVDGLGNVSRFLNRVLALDPDLQNKVFEYFHALFEGAVQTAIRDGNLDTGVKEIPGDRIEIREKKVIATDPETKADTYYYQVDAESKWDVVSPADLAKQMKKHPDGVFYINKNTQALAFAVEAEPIVRETGPVQEAIRTIKPRSKTWVKAAKPPAATERTIIMTVEEYLDQQGDKTNPTEFAKKAWASEFDSTPKTHIDTFHMIGGTVMRHWNTVSEFMRSRDGGIRLARDSKTGERVVGVVIPQGDLSKVIADIGGGTVKVTPDQIVSDVLKNGTEYELQNIRVRRTNIARSPVVQLIPADQATGRVLIDRFHVQYEKGIAPVYYVPDTTLISGEKVSARELLERIMKDFPLAVKKLASDESGSLNLGSWRAKQPFLPPTGKKDLRAIGAAANKFDIPPVEVAKLAKALSGQSDIAKLSPTHAAELVALMGSKLPSGNRVYAAGVRPWSNLESPSKVLGRSLYGARIFAEAQKGFFEQQRLTRRFSSNYHKVTAGLDSAEKNEVARFRLRVDEKGDRVESPAPLSAKLAKVNRNLTAFVYEPMFQIGVKKGLVSERQHFDDYLPYYREEGGKFPGTAKADMAANVALEMGITVSAAEQILEQADTHDVRFGPFDYSRMAKASPELRKLDRITEIYIKGFARKVAINDFLEPANLLRRKIKDEGLRKYARTYIDQYAGVPQYSAADDWLARQKERIPGLRDLNLSGARLAGVMTAVQFQAKLGFNLFSPILNLTQSLVNTVPAFGAVRTFGAMPKGAAAVLLPNSLNPFVKELARLNRSGVLDSQSVKFEQAHFAGYWGKAQDALSYLFNKSEQFNRATAFLAGYGQAKSGGATEAASIAKGREAVRLTQFFSGRLDGPLFTRTPLGSVLMQFKTFTFKEIEFASGLTTAQKIKFAAMAIALGGPAALGLVQAFKTFFPDSDITDRLDEWQETYNVAAFLQADHLGKQFGIYNVPGIEDLGRYDFKGRLMGWAGGPTISTMLDIIDASTKDRDKSEKILAAVLRGVVPGGSELMRINKAMQEAETPEEALRILTALMPAPVAGSGRNVELERLLGR